MRALIGRVQLQRKAPAGQGEGFHGELDAEREVR